MDPLRTLLTQALDDDTLTAEHRRAAFDRFLVALSAGHLRTAANHDGTWRVDPLVKRAILLGFRLGRLTTFPNAGPLSFADKDTYALQPLPLIERNIRIVPGGSAVRAGAYVGHNVTIMPPAYINVGAYVDDDTMIDSHALVGSCAQVGKRCHISAAAQLGGVLEPIGTLPVIIEDDVFVGGNCGIYEGTLVRQGAVLASGTILTRGTTLFDNVHGRSYRATPDGTLEVPPYAVVVPGSRALPGPFAQSHQLHTYAPIIVKYRDARTDRSTALEEALR